MGPLITIETVPISIEYVEQPSARIPTIKSAKLEITREKQHTSVKSNPVKIKMDSFEKADFRSSTYTATANFNNGNLNMEVSFTDSRVAVADKFNQAGRNMGSILNAMPMTKKHTLPIKENYQPSVNYTTSSFEDIADISDNMRAGALKIHFDLSALRDLGNDNASTRFIPPDLKLEISQLPDVIVKYVGGPIYFPRSSDPNYEPPVTDTSNLNTAI